MSEMAQKIVLYDGDCGFCNRSVAYILKHDRSGQTHFASLQSNFCKEFFLKNSWANPDLSTFYFIENGVKYEKSTAALKVSRYFGFAFLFLQIGWIVPRFLRDKGYDFIASRRRLISKNYCFYPTPEQKERFL